MRRKIAFFITLCVTALLITLRFLERYLALPAIAPFGIHDCQLVLCLLTLVAVAVLCFSKTSVVRRPGDTPIGTVCGWLCTFCGAIVTMSAALDIFCWIRYDQVPPPAVFIYNRIDLIASISSLVFGVLGGVYMILQGFSWMAQNAQRKTMLNWLALCPVLWMWFRLARYEISYASTIDIRESFFDFAVLVFGSLFFLQLARTASSVGPAPKNGLLIFSLFTAMASLADAPLTIIDVSSGLPIGNLLVALSDLVIGVFALAVAILQIFQKDEADALPEADAENDDDPVSEEDGLAWTDPVKPQPPLNPAFQMDHVLPAQPDAAANNPDSATDTNSSDTESSESGNDVTVDDLLSEIDSFE